MLAVVVIATAAVVASCALALRWWTWRPLIKRRVVVQLDSGQTLTGIAASRRGPLLVLGDVTVHHAGQATKADGLSVVERRRVLWVQVVN